MLLLTRSIIVHLANSPVMLSDVYSLSCKLNDSILLKSALLYFQWLVIFLIAPHNGIESDNGAFMSYKWPANDTQLFYQYTSESHAARDPQH